MADASFILKLLSQTVESLNKTESSSETETIITVNVKKKSKKRKLNVDNVTVEEQCQKKIKYNDLEIGKKKDMNGTTTLMDKSNCDKHEMTGETKVKVKKQKKKKKHSDDSRDTTQDDITELVNEELGSLHDSKCDNECSSEVVGKSKKKKKKKDKDNNILQPDYSIVDNQKVDFDDKLKHKKKKKKKTEADDNVDTTQDINIELVNEELGSLYDSKCDNECSSKLVGKSKKKKKKDRDNNILQPDYSIVENQKVDFDDKLKHKKKKKKKTEADGSVDTTQDVNTELVNEELGSFSESKCDNECSSELERKSKKKKKKKDKDNKFLQPDYSIVENQKVDFDNKLKHKKKKKKQTEADGSVDTTQDINTELVNEELGSLYESKCDNECSSELERKLKKKKKKKDKDNNNVQLDINVVKDKQIDLDNEFKHKKKKKKNKHKEAMNTLNIDLENYGSVDIEHSDKPEDQSNLDNLLQSDGNSGEELVTEDNYKQKKKKKKKLKEIIDTPSTMINVNSDLVKGKPRSEVKVICNDEIYVVLEKKALKKKKKRKENLTDNSQNNISHSYLDISSEGDLKEINKNMKTDPDSIENKNQHMSIEDTIRESSKLITESTTNVEEISKKKKGTSNLLVSSGDNVLISSDTPKEVQTSKDNIKSEKSFPAMTRPTSSLNTTLISDLYSVPDSNQVGDQIYRACRHILQLNIAVSPVNVACQKNYKPYDPREKGILKSEYGAVFGKYWEEEDNTILFRYRQLKDAGIITDENMLMNELKELNKLYTRGKGKEARNILGLYLGQDMPSKLAEGVCQQLMKIVTGTNLHTSQYKTPPVTPNGATKARPVRWSHDEDTTLVERVLSDSNTGKYKRVEMVDEKLVNWTEIGEELPNRTRELARERWMKIVKIKLINDDQEPEAELDYQRALLEAVALLEAKHKKEIDWKKLEKRFHPKSSSVLAYDFHSLTIHSIHQDLRKTVQAALDKVYDMEGTGFQRALERKRKQGEKNSLLLEFYHSLLRL